MKLNNKFHEKEKHNSYLALAQLCRIFMQTLFDPDILLKSENRNGLI